MGRRPTMLPVTPRNLLVTVVLLAAGAAVAYFKGGEAFPGASSGADTPAGGEAVLAAFEARRSDQWLEASGVVARVLADDNKGDRHQRFILRVAPGHTVLVAHNIDLAPRVPLSDGDLVSLRGEYEFNEKGGVIHWTHHDPGGRHRGGWIRHRDKVYR